MHDQYKPIVTLVGADLSKCPVCGSASALWRFSEEVDAKTEVVVCCSNGDKFGPQTGFMNEGCLLFLPPEDFYRGTIREAVKYWNEYAQALTTLRESKNG